jgi:hypothetical protein
MREGKRCIPYHQIQNRTAVITRDGGHFLNIIYEDDGEWDQVSAHLARIIEPQMELNLCTP